MRIVAVLAFLTFAGPAAAASFDCSKAASPAELAICADPKLSALDVLVSRAYDQARGGTAGTSPDPKDKANALADARLFNARKQRCGTDVGCLISAHVGAIQDLETDGADVQLPASIAATDMTTAVPNETKALPVTEGGCARTRITNIGGRLEGDTDFSSGTSVVFADGGRQVSYDKVSAIVGSRRGDPVLLCLTSIPKHCPPGDDRGRSYTTTNLRTHRSWSLTDTQHMCGGA